MQTTQRNIFTTITTEGALLPADLLGGIADGTADVDGLTPGDYHLAPGEKLNEATSRAWNRLLGAWAGFRTALGNLQAGDAGTTETRERWLLPLFQELGYGRLPTARAQEVDGKTYPISHGWGHVPIHLVGAGVDLDRRTAGVAGAARTSPHSLLQEFLNCSDEHLWGFVANGLRLRILRDNSSLTRQAFVEFDLQAMMDGEVYADFVLLWVLGHQSRVEGDKPAECWLEQWSKAAHEQGTRALDQLRKGVEAAITALGRGFLTHPANQPLRDKLQAGELGQGDYYRQLLRLVYRFIFLFAAEDRDLLFAPDAATEARRRYTEYYSAARLRRLTLRQRGTRHSDLYQTLSLVMRVLGGDDGYAGLGLPALGGFLFQPGAQGAIPDLEAGELANHDLLDAVRELAYTVDDGVRRPVDYRNMGAEELGSVYESLLELQPALSVTAGTFGLKTVTGSERKTTGSYYTPSSLINALLDSALDPVLEEAASQADAQRAVLDLKVCDPACGSGHFLIAAAHRIAKRLATLRTGDAEPTPSAVHTPLREVIGRCLYGVDLNPMAIELCKVSLWMEALEPGKPLSFLDHHIKVGNSLVGATPALLRNGIPDEAFEPIEGDDKAICREYKARNREARKGKQRLFGYDLQPWEQLGNAATALTSLDDIDDSTVEGVRRKQQRYEELVRSQGYLYGRLLADAWCAAFVWKKTNEFNYPITEEVFRRIERNPFDVAPWMRQEIERLAGQYGFFHPQLEYPDVFRVPGPEESPANEQAGWAGGFDVVLGNPPWEHTELKEKEWFNSRRPDIANAHTGAERKRMIEALASEDPPLYLAFSEALRSHDAMSHFSGHSGRFPLTGRGRINTYAIFAETMRVLVEPRGQAGIIVLSGIATDDTTKFFFQDLMESRALVSLYDFENREKLFPAVDSRMKFCLLTVSGSARANQQGAEFVFFALTTDDLKEQDRRFTLTREEIALLNPNTRTCPIFRSKRDAELTKGIYRRVPVLIAEGVGGHEQNPWSISFKQGLFNMTSDSVLFKTREQLGAQGLHLEGNVMCGQGIRFLPMWEDWMIHHYEHRYQSNGGHETTLSQHQDYSYVVQPRYWVEESEVLRSAGALADVGYLIAFRNRTRSTDIRSVISTVIPLAAVGNNVPIINSTQGSLKALLPSNLSSFALDFAARQKIGGLNLNFFIAKQLPVLSPPRYFEQAPWSTAWSLAAWLWPRALELTYTAYDLEPYARDSGYKGPPFGWDEERRFLLRCELDAAYFHLYGIEHNDVEYIMETFPIVKRKDEAAHGGRYRTKATILDIYNAMQQAIDTSVPYQTRLDPPPALGWTPPPLPAFVGAAVGPVGATNGSTSRSVASTPPAANAHGPGPASPAAPNEIASQVSARVFAAQTPAPAPRPPAAVPAARGLARGTAPAPSRSAARDSPGASRPVQQTFLERPAAAPTLTVGQRVKHPTFGEGQVLDVRASGPDQQVTVKFRKAGTKKLMASLARFELVSA
jgi:hypothetical protein